MGRVLPYRQPSVAEISELTAQALAIGYDNAFLPASGDPRGWRLWRNAERPSEMQGEDGGPVLFPDYRAAYQAAIAENRKLIDGRMTEGG